MKNEKILLELKGLKKTKLSSLEITSDLDSFLIEIFSQKIKERNPNISKTKLIKELRKNLFLGRRDT